MSEVLRALATLLDPPSPAHARVAAALELPALPDAADYTDVLAFQAYPYASVYLGADGMLGGDARDRVAGFWRTLGAEPAHEPDHVGALLAGLSQLADAEREAGSPRQAAAARRARGVLLSEHVASFLPAFVTTVRRIGHPFYAAWASLAEAAVLAESEALGETSPRTASLPVFSPVPESTDELLALLLAPARVGFTLVRDDLWRAGDELELSCRAGERRFVLRALLAQDAGGVLGWLAQEADRQADAYAASPLATARGWTRRARASAQWLHARARDAHEAREDMPACASG